ncbi:hypothetical protein ABEB36_003921 [Hypothenemus hampei]|uniref:C2 domain-containing protein n=1 Tax=Hypothenemus hampei TaxID=57062 RepID=A0ABD1F1Y1_HYPHA
MGTEQLALAIICSALIAVMLVVFFYNSLNILAWINAWICSNKEEKAGLTRLKGHYNANGYLVHSDSDIQLDWSNGSFKRFDSIDRDFKTSIATTSLTQWQIGLEEPSIGIPPQPLRPAPVPQIQREEIPMEFSLLKAEPLVIESTSISPIPRPVSSINMAALGQSTFPINLDPPPTRNVSRTQSAPWKLSQQGLHHNETGSSNFEESEGVLKRALSCESVCSDSSVALDDLLNTNLTGYLCIGLEYDSETWDFIVNVLEAKDLSGIAKVDGYMDTYVRVSLLPDKEATIQTKVYRSSITSPSYKERFLFSLNPKEQMQRALCFQLYAIDVTSHTLIGEGELKLTDVSLRQPVTTWVTLTDTGQKGTEFGEIMFSLSYLPTAERLTVVVVKARNLKFQPNSTTEVFVKVYLMQQNKKINKKKTSTKKGERSPIFNEAMMFSVPAHTLNTIQLRVTVAEVPQDDSLKAAPIGHVIISGQSNGRSLSHWNQMLTTLRKPVAMWHLIRK